MQRSENAYPASRTRLHFGFYELFMGSWTSCVCLPKAWYMMSLQSASNGICRDDIHVVHQTPLLSFIAIRATQHIWQPGRLCPGQMVGNGG
jgi:hypothetical protein